MRRVLAYISDEDRDKGISLTSILATYHTLMEIEGYLLDKEEIKRKISNVQKETTSFWAYLSDKYMFPLYLDRVMKIDNENNAIYIDD